MTQPSESELEDIKNRIVELGYQSYTVSRKVSETRQYSRKKQSANPFFIVKNIVSNRVFQIKWDGNYHEFVREILAKIEKYETTEAKYRHPILSDH